MSQTYAYRTHGLSLHSEIQLPLPSVASMSPDAVVRLGPVDREGLVSRSLGYRSTATAEPFRMEWEGIGAFRVSGGSEILVDPTSGADAVALLQLLVGSALAVLLHQRGRLVLHASAVLDTQGQALVILGHSGQGKSTLAAAFQRAGLMHLSDDLAPVECLDGRARLHPGPGWMKLWPETVETVLGLEAGPLMRLYPEGEKRLFPLPAPSVTASVPVGTVVVLHDGDRLQVEPIRGGEAVAELTRYSFCARLLTRADGPQHLRQCADLIRTRPIYRFHRPRDLEQLPQGVEMLLRQLGHAGQPK